MTIQRHRLEEAAFWHYGVCLDCEKLCDLDLVEDRSACPSCNSPRMFPAETILACADFVEEEDE